MIADPTPWVSVLRGQAHCYATITDSHAANETITPSSTRHAETTLT